MHGAQLVLLLAPSILAERLSHFSEELGANSQLNVFCNGRCPSLVIKE